MRIITFEGGLGSQMIPFLEMKYLDSEKMPYELNLEYFESALPVNEKRRPWALSHYGIELANLKSRPSSFGQVWRKNFVFEDEIFWEFVKESGSSLFPVLKQSTHSELIKIGASPEIPYSAIHIRRGDYLQLASKLVSNEEIVQFAKKMISVLDDQILLVSDSNIDRELFLQISQLCDSNNRRLFLLDDNSIPDVKVHEILRSANTLLCSNSTFSFTAALLAETGAKAFAPLSFYDPFSWGGASEILNSRYRKSGDFFLIK